MTARKTQKKICMLGMFGVGKTSLVQRFVYDRFDDSYLSTIGVKVYQKLLAPVESDPGNHIQYELLIWDIEGIEDSGGPASNYMLGASGALIVADLTRMETIECVPTIVRSFKKLTGAKHLVLAGNKADLSGPSSEAIDSLRETAEEYQLPCFLTSAKTGEQVEVVFENLGLLLANDEV